jgi:hypothetical protein
MREQLAAHDLLATGSMTGQVAHTEAVSLMWRSAALLLAGPTAGDPLARGHLPGKVFEYLATDRPILHCGDPHSDVATLLAGQPGCVVAAGQADALQVLADATATRHARDATTWSRRRRAADLAEVLDRVLG